MGFENEEAINNFNKIDFSLYKNFFPNRIALIFSFIFGFIFLGLLFINIILVISKIKGGSCGQDCSLCIGIISAIAYIPSFLGFFIYTLVKYCQAPAPNHESFEIAKKIKADKFIEDFLKEFVKRLGLKQFTFHFNYFPPKII